MFSRVNRSGALAAVALVASLASSSYAAGVLPLPGATVGSTQLKRGAVGAVKIATGAVTGSCRPRGHAAARRSRPR